MFHNNVPAAVVDNVDVPLQLFTTFTEGVAGGVPALTVYVPEVVQVPEVAVTEY